MTHIPMGDSGAYFNFLQSGNSVLRSTALSFVHLAFNVTSEILP